MSIIRYLKRLEYTDFLIRRKATGNLTSLAQKLCLSKRGVTDLLSEMRTLGADIKYDKCNETYYYNTKGAFCPSKFVEIGVPVTTNELKGVKSIDDICISEANQFVPCKKHDNE